jgi:hypothetical protein
LEKATGGFPACSSTGTEIMTLLQKSPVSVCANVARYVLGCLVISLVFAGLANADTLGVDSYNSWQWNGFSRTLIAPSDSSASTSILASLSSQSWSSANVVSESAVESAVAASSSSTTSTSLSGVVYYDENGDGIRESSDWAIRDAIVALLPASSDTIVYATTDKDGVYTFKNLTADTYTVTLMTPSTAPGQSVTVGILADENGNYIFTGLGIATGSSIANIQLQDGYVGTAYDFPQLVYPTNSISKRMLLNNDPGVSHTPDAPTPPVVPEPSSLALLMVAGIAVTGFARRRLG